MTVDPTLARRFQEAMNAPSDAAALAEACADLIAAGETVLRLDFDTHGMRTLNRALQVARHALANWQAQDKEDR